MLPLILLLLLSQTCQADVGGVNFAGLSGNDQSMSVTIPIFKSLKESERFAIRYLSIESVRRSLRKQAGYYRDFAKLNGNPTQKEIHSAEFNITQAEFCERAYNIMTYYKKTHEVGAIVEFGMIPLNRGYVYER